MSSDERRSDDARLEDISLSEAVLSVPLATPQPYDENDIDQIRARLAASEIVISEFGDRLRQIIADRDQRRGIITKLRLELQAVRTENEALQKRIAELEGRPTTH